MPDLINIPRVLLVDDDPAVRESLAQALRGERYTVFTTVNGREAIEFTEASPVDLVLLDLNMPEKSGWDAFERMSSGRPMLPIIIITARPNQLFTAMSAGVDALLEKPLDLPQLLATMEELLRENPEKRLERRLGKKCEFRYLPAHV